MKSPLITVRPKVKQKGFNPDNIGISAFTKEDTGVYNRILRMTTTPFYKDLDINKKQIVDLFLESYKYKMEGKSGNKAYVNVRNKWNNCDSERGKER